MISVTHKETGTKRMFAPLQWSLLPDDVKRNWIEDSPSEMPEIKNTITEIRAKKEDPEIKSDGEINVVGSGEVKEPAKRGPKKKSE